jgi:hypothetical protein
VGQQVDLVGLGLIQHPDETYEHHTVKHGKAYTAKNHVQCITAETGWAALPSEVYPTGGNF